MDNYFAELNAVNVNDKTEKKNNLTYLSWAWAWAEVKKRYPRSYYTVYENAQGWCYHTDGRTCWVKTGVTVVTDDMSLEHIEFLPVMDFRNASIPADKVTSFDVNKAIQRSLTKAVARHGLGLYVYAGEDLPECEEAAPAARVLTPSTVTTVSAEALAKRKELIVKTVKAYGGNEQTLHEAEAKITAATKQDIKPLKVMTDSEYSDHLMALTNILTATKGGAA
jgi:hypothetical protein